MDDLKRKRFLQCLKTDTEDITVHDMTYWTPGSIVWTAYNADYEGMATKDRGIF